MVANPGTRSFLLRSAPTYENESIKCLPRESGLGRTFHMASSRVSVDFMTSNVVVLVNLLR